MRKVSRSQRDDQEIRRLEQQCWWLIDCGGQIEGQINEPLAQIKG